MGHPEKVLRYPGTLEELAEDIGNLRYDALANFLEALALKLAKDSEQDAVRNRLKLAAQLQEGSRLVTNSKSCIDMAWIISKPYM